MAYPTTEKELEEQMTFKSPFSQWLWYVYPTHHTVSFTLVAKEHIKQLRKKFTVHEVEELTFLDIQPYSSPFVLIHPLIYVCSRDYTKFAWRRTQYRRVIGVEVADSDRLSDEAMGYTNLCDAIIVPSTWSRDAYVRSGCVAPVHVVPHGLKECFLRPKRDPIKPEFNFLRKLKEDKGYVYVLYFLWHCYDEKTRALTKSGFKYWWELTKDDEIATVNLNTGELEYQKPEEIIVADYNGEMIHFHGMHYDLLVTPNHRMVVRISKHYKAPYLRRNMVSEVIDPSRKWEIKLANDLASPDEAVRWELMRAVKWKGKRMEYYNLPDLMLEEGYPTWVLGKVKNEPSSKKRVPMKPLLRFLGWFISEGSASYHPHNQQYAIYIWNKNSDNINEILSTIKEMGFNAHYYKKGNCVIVSSKQLYMLLRSLGLPLNPDVKGKKTTEKFVPSFIKELTPDLIAEFLDALWKGDGSYFRTKSGEKRFMKYTTTSKRLAEDVAELLLKMGYAVSICYTKKDGNRHDIYDVIPSSRYRFPAMKNLPQRVPYNGKIWCVTVPNGTLIVERNGKIVVSGNSGRRKGADLVYRVMNEVQKARENVVLVLKASSLSIDASFAFDKEKTVLITGWLNDDEVVDLYDLCDIYLLFSRGGGFELNGLEALARGEIVLGAEEGSWRDYLPDEFTLPVARRVKVFENNPFHIGMGPEIDVQKAIDKVINIVDNIDKWKERTSKVSDEIRKKWTWDNAGEKLINVVEQYY